MGRRAGGWHLLARIRKRIVFSHANAGRRINREHRKPGRVDYYYPYPIALLRDQSLASRLVVLRACHQLSQTMLATSRTAARKLRAVFSYRVAIAGNCLILAMKFSIRWRAT